MFQQNKTKLVLLKLVRGSVFIAALALVATIAYGNVALNKDPLPNSRSIKENRVVNALEVRNYWSDKIDRLGAADAYQQFQENYQGKSFSEQHVAAHVLGALLYDKVGFSGITICDDAFGFGCFHSLFSSSFADHGLDVVEDLDRACVERYGKLGTGCLHGIGHGLVEYLGPDRLLEALESCRKTTQVNPLFGCTTGAFMEYNIHINVDAEGASTKFRDLTSAGPYYPCPTLDNSSFRQTCYFEIGQWWNRIFDGDYRKMGELCQEISAQDEREPCFIGLGKVASPSTEYDIQKTVAMCQQITFTEGEIFCRTGAAWAFLADPRRKHQANEICADLTELERQTCVQKSDLIGEKTKIQ